ncbi:hypothetical protein [Amycolatopsis keratiniphila]|uniref:Uncharacterized protein n=1 Tax=Amycolatopsis keratiniphila TaxID=129921 RepID=R4T0M1_9PSEU|nr:hypothetical protein [Amycolatopsis keratiniphila]AGM05931.1 hypothetical protein AORI_3346 [Amycolatopsis keratiniphila]
MPGKFLDHITRLVDGLTMQRRRTISAFVHRLSSQLSEPDQRVLLRALADPYPAVGRLEYEPTVPHVVRHRLLPVAVHRAQQELESAVLHALLQGMVLLESHPVARDYRVGHLVDDVRSSPDELRLRLHPVVLGPLLTNLLPIVDPDDPAELYGTAGARVYWDDLERVELWLADFSPQPRVVITGISETAWKAAKAYLDAEQSSALLLADAYPHSLAPAEAEVLARRPRVFGPNSLGSGVLRRIGVFRDAWWVKSSVRGDESLVVEWPDAPSQLNVLEQLCHRATQLTPGRFRLDIDPSGRIVELHDIDSSVPLPNDPGCKLLLRRISTTREEYLRSRHRYTPVPDHWQAWQKVFQAGRREVQLDLAVLWNRYTGEELHPSSDRVVKIRKAVTSTPHGKAIPEAHSTAQRILETSLLLMIRGSQPPYSGERYRGHQVFRMVSPRRDKMVINLHEKVLRWFLRAMLAPVQPHPGTDGLPGLRIVPRQHALELRLLDHDSVCTDALVVLDGVGAKRWREIWPNIRDSVHYDSGCVDPELMTSPRLSNGERAGMKFHRHSCGPISLGSAFLRRFGLVSCAYAVDVWTGGEGRDLHVEIDQGPSIPTLLDALADPVFGLVDGSVSIMHPSQRHPRVQDQRVVPDRYIGRENPPRRPPALILRQLDPSTRPSAMPSPVIS